MKRKYAIATGVVFAAYPVIANAVVMTFTYDPNDMMVNGVVTPLTGPSSEPTLVVQPGATIDIGVDVDVSNNPNSTLAYHGIYDSVSGPHHYLQPQNLGVAAFGMGFNTSSLTIAPFDTGEDNGNIVINPNFESLLYYGQLDSNNNILLGSVSGANIVSSVNTASVAGVALLSYGAETPAELFNSLQIDAGVPGSAIITPTGINDSDESYVAYNSGGTSASSRPVYKNVYATATDTLVQLPPLTVIVAPVPEPAAAAAIGLGAMGLLTRRHHRATRFAGKQNSG